MLNLSRWINFRRHLSDHLGSSLRRQRASKSGRVFDFGRLEPRRVLDAGSFAGNDCPPDLELASVPEQTIAPGETLTLNLFSEGATVADIDSGGTPTGDTIRLVLDQDVPDDNPLGATITDDGNFSWTPTADQVGTHEIIVIAVDSGSPILGDAETFTVVVADVTNTAPVIDLNGDDEGTGFGTTFVEDGGPVSIVGDTATIVDNEDTQLTTATVRITNRLNGIAETLSTNVGATGITAAYDADTGILTLTGAATVGEYQQVFRNVMYENAAHNPDLTDRVVEFIVSDGDATSDVAISTISITPQNDLSVLDLNGPGNTGVGNDAVFSVGGGPVSIVDSTATLVDADDTMVESATIVISNPLNGSSEVLNVTDSGSLTVDYDAATATLTLTGADTLENYQSAIRSLTYNNSADTIATADRSILVSVNDGSDESAARVITVMINTDSPVLDLNGAANGTSFLTTFTEDGGPVSVVPADVTIVDTLETEMASATVAITNREDGTSEILTADTTGTSITANYDTATGVMQLTGTDTIANYQTVLSTITYENTDQDPNIDDRRIRFTVNDGANNSNTAITTVELESTSDSPQLTLPAPFDQASVGATVGDTVTFDASVFDPDSGTDELFYVLDLDNSGIPSTSSMPTITSAPDTIPGGGFSWVPDTAGDYLIIVIVTDEAGNADQERFTLSVVEAVARPLSDSVVTEDEMIKAIGAISILESEKICAEWECVFESDPEIEIDPAEAIDALMAETKLGDVDVEEISDIEFAERDAADIVMKGDLSDVELISYVR